METIKFNKRQMIKEPTVCNGYERYSHPAFTRKIPKDIIPLDYSKDERLIEIQLEDGKTTWINVGVFFGKVIAETKKIQIVIDNGNIYDDIKIVDVHPFKVKRTMYWKLIFECLLPF